MRFPIKTVLVLLLTLLVVAGGVWFYRHRTRGTVGPLYDQALSEYRRGNYAESIRKLEAASALDPNLVRVNVLLGWNHWRLGEAERAEFYFAKAYNLDNSIEDAKMGLAFASLARGKTNVALPLLKELAPRHPTDKDIQYALADAYTRSGDNLAAVKACQAILQRDPSDAYAQLELVSLYGYPDYRSNFPLTFPPIARPAEPQIFFRTQKDYLQARVGDEWKTIYPVGVNLGPARPGEFPSTPSRDFAIYFEWLAQMAKMNANTVRLYTVLPPAFYQALKAYNETAPAPLWLIHEIWIHDEVENLYDPVNDREFQEDLKDVIDLLHGQANLGYRPGHNYGIYTADVSRYVLGLGVGREIEPRMVLITNRKNPSVLSYKGRYVSLPHGTPTEVWFARMCDLAAQYEIEKYHAQRPLTVVNWPPLDPIHHPTEATYAEELRIRKRLGEVVPDWVPDDLNDNDVSSLDVVKFRTESGFSAGLFALYHVYQHWPDFLLHEPSYERARDAQGPNRYLGYLQELKKAHRNFPLLIGEYGLSTSLGAAHLHPQGWNNGGLRERQQAELLVRFTKNIRETGCAGAVVFSWQDEWFKHVHDVFTADFEMPWDRNPLWLNKLDPEKHFGIVGYEPAVAVPLLRGTRADWQGAQKLFEGGGQAATPGKLRAVSAKSDFAYLYLLLDVVPGAVDWDRRNYWLALNTLPGESGSRLLPEIGVRLDSGANFLIQLTGPATSRILIAENYNPNHFEPIPGRPGQQRIWRKQGMKLQLVDSDPFEEILTEANSPRYARDGRVFPALNYSRSPLPYGIADRQNPQYDSHALWHVDAEQGMIELRIPWGLLLMMDPSNLQAFAGTDEKQYTSAPGAWLPLPRTTKGVSVAVFALQVPPKGQTAPKTVTSALPPVREGKLASAPPVYTWQKWNQIQVRPYFKQSYFALQKIFGEIGKAAIPLPGK